MAETVEEIIIAYETLIRQAAITDVETYNENLEEEAPPVEEGEEPPALPLETPIARIVRGKLLDSPEKYAPCCLIYHDPENGSELNEDEMMIGSTAWFHHIVIEVLYFETRSGRDRATARADAFKVFDRVKGAILDNPMITLGNDEGAYGNEAALRNFVYLEEGGPPKSWIWKAKFNLRVKTERV